MKTRYIKHFQDQLSKVKPLTEEARQEMNAHREKNNRDLIPKDRVGHTRLLVAIYEKNEDDDTKADLTITVHQIWEDEVDSFLEEHGTHHVKNTASMPYFASKKTAAYINYLEECIDQADHVEIDKNQSERGNT